MLPEEFNPAETATNLYSEGLDLVNQGLYSDALGVLLLVLKIQNHYRDIPPCICKLDIARTLLSISLTMKLMSVPSLAEYYCQTALEHLIEFYGSEDIGIIQETQHLLAAYRISHRSRSEEFKYADEA